ncbi:MAG: hypothetical protein HYZ84_04255 [Candidatus Omnitrophica bacterium]|nr:hypothetical protein [Candidatus Omnitrophota bacterium]
MFRNMAEQLKLMQRLMQDDNFKAFMGHPKVQDLFKDPQIQQAMKSKNADLVMNHPKMMALRNDPELAQIISKLNFKDLM